MNIAIGADHGGFQRKQALKKHLEEKGHRVHDVGTDSLESVNYPKYAHAAANLIKEGKCQFGILICGSGIGIGIAANKVAGIRCATVSEPYSATLARQHNDANMISLGARIIGEDMSKAIVDAFLDAEFQGGRHIQRVQEIEEL